MLLNTTTLWSVLYGDGPDSDLEEESHSWASDFKVLINEKIDRETVSNAAKKSPLTYLSPDSLLQAQDLFVETLSNSSMLVYSADERVKKLIIQTMTVPFLVKDSGSGILHRKHYFHHFLLIKTSLAMIIRLEIRVFFKMW